MEALTVEEIEAKWNALTKIEQEVLLEAAGLRKPPRPWGAAVGAAYGTLKAERLVRLNHEVLPEVKVWLTTMQEKSAAKSNKVPINLKVDFKG